MTETPRLAAELADALGATQAVRAAAAAAADRADGKLAARLARMDAELGDVQERVNELVVSSPPAGRAALTARARRLRDSGLGAQPERGGDTDALDAVQALAAEAAFAVAQWTVVRRMAKDAGDERARTLAKRALPMAERHLTIALEGVDGMAKRQAKDDAAGR